MIKDGVIVARPAQEDEVAMKLLRTLSIVIRVENLEEALAELRFYMRRGRRLKPGGRNVRRGPPRQ